VAVSGSDVYAGGDFTMAGGSAANHIAKWSGNNWFALGSGLGGNSTTVLALAVSGNDVYAAGNFMTAGGNTANYIAKWNGSSWSALGSGLGGAGVAALAMSGSDLYAGGAFTTAGGVAATCVAKWNGSSWSALGSGVNGYVNALAVSGSDLYAGGPFGTAGGKVSPFIARAYLPDLPALSVRRSGTDVKILWPSVDTSDFTLEQANTLTPSASWIKSAASIIEDGTNRSLSVPATNSPQFFRLRRP